eukprot:TRINITY_DN56834_c0_g1_i1.p1 TRINITY_DN56834_c0_g1~~TRINITY_DN56834_c0_g1_i1.p1  ORF type:complete len:130 (+),score=28.37 TRINITY_DN56834_c0_g1_i1:18-407(+)
MANFGSGQASHGTGMLERRAALTRVAELFNTPESLGFSRSTTLQPLFGFNTQSAQIDPAALKRMREGAADGTGRFASAPGRPSGRTGDSFGGGSNSAGYPSSAAAAGSWATSSSASFGRAAFDSNAAWK